MDDRIKVPLRKRLEEKLAKDTEAEVAAKVNSFANFFLFADRGITLSGVAVEMFDDGELTDEDMNYLFNTKEGVVDYSNLRCEVCQSYYDRKRKDVC